MKQPRVICLFGAIWIVGCLLFSAKSASARINGIATASCEGCHGSGGTVTADAPSSVQPGAQVTLTIHVTGPDAVGGGFFIYNQENEGTFSVIDGEGTKINDNGVSHSNRKNAVDGVVTFRVNWTAPTVPGASRFSVAGVAANGNGQPSGDHAGLTSFDIVYGCTGITVYRDYDGDGYGSDLYSKIACGPSAGFSDKAGDCNENDASIHPGATETCNQVDDNCNGEIDEGLEGVTIYRDADGDGYGVPTETAIGCGTRKGFAGNADDCNDADPLVHPNASELCNGRDDNCDQVVDEGLIPTCGVGSCERSAESCFITECIPGDPEPEVCNGLDDDCNGVTDDGDICPSGQICVDALCVPGMSLDGASDATLPPDGNEPPPDAASIRPDPDPEPDPSPAAGGNSGQAGATNVAGSTASDGPSVKGSKSSGGGCAVAIGVRQFHPVAILFALGLLIGRRRVRRSSRPLISSRHAVPRGNNRGQG